MMPSQRGVILPIPTSLTTPASFSDQIELAALAPGLLANIVLVAIIGVGVLANPAAILALAAFKPAPANGT